jgi:hypothetical protein
LINAVSASTEGFADANMGPARARAWIIEHYPDAYEWEEEEEDASDLSPEEQAELAAERRERKIRARPGGRPPSEEGVRADLGMAPDDSVPLTGDPERGLVPLVRARLARARQESLATMVRLGLHRIVIDSGRISASMRFHIDTRDAVASDQGSRFALENEIAAAGSFGVGPWGASASVRNNISYVSTQRTQSTSEMNTDLELNSAVEIYIRSDYVPLNTMANQAQVEAIRLNSRNPSAPAAGADAARRDTQRASEAARREATADLLRPERREPLREGAAGTEGAARRAHDDAEAGRPQQPRGDQGGGGGGAGGAGGGAGARPSQQPQGGAGQQPAGGATQAPQGGAQQPAGGASQPPQGGAQQPVGASQPQQGGAQQPGGAAAQPPQRSSAAQPPGGGGPAAPAASPQPPGNQSGQARTREAPPPRTSGPPPPRPA